MIPFRGTVWRILSAERADDILQPARHPEGRFHHSGQVAIYASLSAEGAGVALRRYVRSGDPPRVIAPIRVDLPRVADHRGNPALSLIWQDLRAQGLPAPTWAASDAARSTGADALLYSSRSRPDLGHIVIFTQAPGALVPNGPATPWAPPYPVPD